MNKVLVRGLDGEGPGDIVGAFVNEAGISPDSIGEIEIDEGEATVEVAESETNRVVESMDGSRVGGSEVSVTQLDSSTKQVLDYVEEYKRLVELEREAEMERHESEIRSLSGKEREDKGRAILHLRGSDEGEGLGGYHVKFMRQHKGEQLPDTEISVGDLVMISKNDPLRDDNPTGTVIEKTNYSITLAFDSKPHGFVFGKGLRADLYVNDITYQRMKEALDKLPDASESLGELRDIIVGTKNPSEPENAEVEEWKNSELNSSQKEAVRRALEADNFHLVHGPPGTGKTTTAIELIQQCVARDETVLATAASNTAVDNIVEFLVEHGVDVVRVGHPARVTPTLREHTLDSVIEDNEKYRKSKELRDEAFEILDKQDDLTHPSGRWRRGLSNERIKELAEEGKGSRGVPPEKIEEMAEWLELQEEADQLFERSDELEDEAVDEIIEDADVVCTTNSTSGSELMDGRKFDTLVIDEATQATEPSCLIPITHADRVVMAGDHRQLPPTVQSREAEKDGLGETLFERLAERHPEITDMLTVQYRMHREIMDFSSQNFYDGNLRASDSVESHTLDDLTDAELKSVLKPDEPGVFVDTSRIEAPEKQREGSTSRENPQEAQLVSRYAEACLEAGIDPRDIAVISPYDDQVEAIEDKIGDEELEVDTVDGFQGREKEVVLVSLVRSNPRNRIGFLDEPRRFNVAATRAKRKLVVVGDSSTVTQADVFDDFVDYVDSLGNRRVL